MEPSQEQEQEQEPSVLDLTVPALANVHYNACDESKCVARGRADLVGDFVYDRFDQEDVVTCYGDQNGEFFPKMCADGFVPVTLNEPTVNVSGATKNCINQLWRAYILHNFTDLPLEYFTCCPPKAVDDAPEDAEFATPSAIAISNATLPSRHCSDPVFAPKGWKEDDDYADETVAALCEGMGERKYPRRTKKFWGKASFVCCDTLEPLDEEAETTTINFTEPSAISWIETSETSYFDDVECIPYSNLYYDRGFMDRNRVGRTWINKRLCDFPGGDDRFRYPRLLDGMVEDVPGADQTRRYQCCTKPGEPLLEPYVTDSRYYIECYTWLVLFVVAAVASAVIAIALSLPVVFGNPPSLTNNYHNHKRHKQPIFASTTKIDKSHHTVGKSHRDSGNRFKRRQSQHSQQPPSRQISYSPYNLYLVYLAIPDLVVSLTFVFGVCVRMIHQQPVNHNLIGSIVLVYGLANCLLNAMVCHQVFVLLKKSHQRQRVAPPTLNSVTLQSVGIYVFSAVVFPWVYLPVELAQRAYHNGNYDKGAALESLSTVALSITGAMVFVPILYVLWVSYTIWRRNYIPPATTNRMSVTHRANRALAIYFFRIVAVFFIVWILGAIVGGLATAFTIMEGNNWPMYVFFTLVGVQQIATTGVILMSPVSRQYVQALFVLSYCFPHRNRGHHHYDHSGSHHHSHRHGSSDQTNTHLANHTLTSHCSATESPPSAAMVVETGGAANAEAAAATETPEPTPSRRESIKSSVDLWLSSRDEVQASEDSCDSAMLALDQSVDLSDFESSAILRSAEAFQESSDDIRASIAVLQQFSSSREVLDLFSASTRRGSHNHMMHDSIPEQADVTERMANGMAKNGVVVPEEEGAVPIPMS